MEPVDVDETTLKQIAQITGGQYYRADNAEKFQQIYAEINKLEKTEAVVNKFTEYKELFPWFVSLGLALLTGRNDAGANHLPETAMRFAQPYLLWLLLVLPALALFFWWASRQRQRLLAQFIQVRLLSALTVGISPARRKIRFGCLILAVALLMVALARPQYGFDLQKDRTARPGHRGRD